MAHSFLPVRGAAALLAIALTSSSFAQTSEPGATERALEQLQRALEQERGMSPETRDAFRGFAEAMQAELATTRETATAQPVLARPEATYASTDPADEDRRAAWEDVFERLKVSGDVRFRHESSFDLDDRKNRHRQRMRVRLRVAYELSDELTLGLGIRTGDRRDPNSPYITLGDGFDDFEVSIDRAYARYVPAWGNGLSITAGKFVNPIKRNPVYGELVWDGDVNPEGAVLGVTSEDGGLGFLVGGYTVVEDANTDEVWLLATQGSAKMSLGDGVSSTIAVGYYLYSDVTPDGQVSLLGDNAGNVVVDRDMDTNADDFASDFGILNPIASVTWDGGEMPFTVAGEYILNTKAVGDLDAGWALGAALGRTKRRGDWKVYYQWQEIEQDSIFSGFAQDDFVLTTNFRGHVFGGNYLFADNVNFHVWGLVAARDLTFPAVPTADSDEDQWRLRADLTIKF